MLISYVKNFRAALASQCLKDLSSLCLTILPSKFMPVDLCLHSRERESRRHFQLVSLTTIVVTWQILATREARNQVFIALSTAKYIW